MPASLKKPSRDKIRSDCGFGQPAPELRKQRAARSIAAPLQRISDDRDRAMLIGKVVGAAASITEANIALFAQAIFEEFRRPAEERDEKRLAQYMTLALRARDQDLKARNIDLGVSRFQFDAAKKALAFVSQLERINQAGGDEREKVEQAIVVLFGQTPEPASPIENQNSQFETP